LCPAQARSGALHHGHFQHPAHDLSIAPIRILCKRRLTMGGCFRLCMQRLKMKGPMQLLFIFSTVTLERGNLIAQLVCRELLS
jgi:hypothetical protein